MTYRNRQLLDLCHEAPCCLKLGLPGCGHDASVPCHSDMIRHGRGKDEKSHDCFAVPGCPVCHEAWKRSKLGREGYFEKWVEAMERYTLWLWVSDRIRLVTSPNAPRETSMKPPRCRLCEKEHWAREGCDFGKNTTRGNHGVLKAKAARPDATPSPATATATPQPEAKKATRGEPKAPEPKPRHPEPAARHPAIKRKTKRKGKKK